jgi:hypothetical protein
MLPFRPISFAVLAWGNWKQLASPWLRPYALTDAEVSLSLKHRLIRQKIAEGMDEWAIVAEESYRRILVTEGVRRQLELAV